MRRVVVLLPLLLLCAAAHAQAVFKCTKKGAAALYTTEACPPGYVLNKATTFKPDPYAKPYRPDLRARPYATRRVPQAAHVQVTRQPSACEAARSYRDAMLGSNNQRGGVDLRRQLNDQVHRACY